MTNSPESAIISFLLKINNYKRYIRYIDINKELKELVILYHTLKLLQEKFPDTDKSVDDLELAVFANYPRLSSVERSAISDLCTSIRSVNLSNDVALSMLGTIEQRAKAREVALSFLEVSEGRREWDEACQIVQTVKTDPIDFSHKFVTDKLSELRLKTFEGGGLYWPLRSLNLALGPLRRGDFGFVFGRPETGKTTFLSHAITHMAVQDDRPIAWFNNEEQGEKVRTRTFQATFGCTIDDLFGDPEREQRYQQEYDSKLGGRLRIIDDDNGATDRFEIESIVEHLKPSLIIIDQIDKVSGFAADRRDLEFGEIYRWARSLAKKHCPVIGTCQADGTGEGVKWLTMSHVAEAKTSKQAEADWILGIGRSNESGTEHVRFFNISKNKLLGDKNTDPELRHGRFDVWIRPQIARYEDILDG